jgi:hypothetical protein
MGKAITIENLKKSHGADKADEIYNQIAAIGGFGNFANDFAGGDRPALDVSGCQPDVQKEIEKLLAEKKNPANK